MNQSNFEQAEEILLDWLNHENDSHPNDPKLPLHSEFHYRKSGEWTSWNDFLATPENTDAFRSNEARDAVENQAWQLYVQRYSN